MSVMRGEIHGWRGTDTSWGFFFIHDPKNHQKESICEHEKICFLSHLYFSMKWPKSKERNMSCFGPAHCASGLVGVVCLTMCCLWLICALKYVDYLHPDCEKSEHIIQVFESILVVISWGISNNVGIADWHILSRNIWFSKNHRKVLFLGASGGQVQILQHIILFFLW